MTAPWSPILAIVIPTSVNFAIMLASGASWFGAVQATSALTQRMAVVEEQIKSIQSLVSDHYSEEKDFRSEMRNALSHISDLMGEINRQLDGKPRGR